MACASNLLMRVMPDLPATMLAQPVATSLPTESHQAKAGDDDSASCQDALLTEEQNGVFAGKCMHAQTKHRKTRQTPAGLPAGVWTTVCHLRGNASLSLVAAHVVDGLLNGGDLFSFFVRDFAAEFFFQRHHQFDGVERIRAQIVDEGRFVLHFSFVHAPVARPRSS